ncbi:mfs transporter : Major facilitator superfamily OS=Cloacamonas acidaminovorans (strain Evry) GN=CLOAM1481 PE=4 SV=1: MFS_1 [Gemmataceae bacterium]|nr:mfs transporter : Major facilitator superfamily OS=Cloacamonas acidaminovorans (strain Evry) GN=CLOAM1481 PE=4 SV=1: MFS_1 [Gemmataceae bacterium]VTT99603.1 mfs transporter : Major facilitator superfamily OS=Cloacamonas acidaminovorans (strain Evry) GN=CLOAM1481 PE=4 SV=1: MFS_1 [Gemmataceae bacterium]
MGDGTPGRPSFAARFLALNRTVGVVLVAVLCFGMGQQLWEPLVPNFFRDQSVAAGAASAGGLSGAVLVTVGVYSFLKNLINAACFLGGGGVTARLGDRRALILFGWLALAGYALFLAAPTNWAALVAALLILSWDPLSVPVTFTTVAASVRSERRGLAFAVQAVQKRLPKVIGPAAAGFVLHHAGEWAATPEEGRVLGMRVLVGAALVLGAVALVVQYRWMPDRPPEAAGAPAGAVWRTLPGPARRLLLAEVFTRWCDWLVRDFVVLYLVVVRGVTLREVGLLVALQNLVSLASYLPIGRLTVVVGTRPFVGLTFAFTAVFPLLLAVTPTGWLVVAFVAGGLREVGDPARKALLTDLLPDGTRARAVGLYWGLRTFAASWAALAGAALWATLGPVPLLYAACGFGLIGAAAFYLLVVPRLAAAGRPAPETKP